MDKKKNKIICALYTRVSSRSQMVNDYSSLDSQKEKLEAYCKSQDNYEIYRVYVEGGFSGDSVKRPALQEMIRDFQKGKINCVLVYKIDRLTRSVKDFHTLMEEFDKYNVNFVSITQNIDTNHPTGRLLRNILLDFAQFEREMISDRTRDKMQQRAQKGLWNGGIPPYGYLRENKKLLPNPEEEPIIKFMFNNFGINPSLSSLRLELEKYGYLPRSNGRWSKSAIAHILRNPVYIGKTRSKGKIYKGQHEAIIDETLFKRIQLMHPTRSHPTSRIEKVYLLKGLIRCSDCGSVMTPHYTQKRNKDNSINRIPYYRCTKTMNFSNRVCKIKSFNANKIEKIVINDLYDLSQNETYLNKSIEKLNGDLKNQIGPLEDEAKKIKLRISELEAQIDKYVQAIGVGKISIDRLEKEIEFREKNLKILNFELEEITRKINEQAFEEYDADLVRKSLQDFSIAFEALGPKDQAEAIQCILKDVIIYQDKIILDIFELPEFSGSSQNRITKLPRQDSNLRPAD